MFVCNKLKFIRLEQSDFKGQSIRGKMEIQLEKPAMNSFKAHG